jgi:two-component system phosphate regulon sensor histidine kinase PhoR
MESIAAFQNVPAMTSAVSLPAMHVLTHELRSPVKVTSSLLNVLSRGYVGELNDKQADLVDRARKRIDLLESLIDDLLDLASGKGDAPAVRERVSVPLSELLPEVCARYETLAGEKGLSLKCDCPLDEALSVLGDTTELDRILSNLISNAVKYTQAGGVVARGSRVGDWARITVTDTGIGIPADALPRLFQEFFRARNAKALQEYGTGLGLAIVRDLVERYGGHIEVRSIEGAGTTFTVLLPLV